MQYFRRGPVRVWLGGVHSLTRDCRSANAPLKLDTLSELHSHKALTANSATLFLRQLSKHFALSFAAQGFHIRPASVQSVNAKPTPLDLYHQVHATVAHSLHLTPQSLQGT